MSQTYPGRQDLTVLCWTTPQNHAGYLSRIVVFQLNDRGAAKPLWESPIEDSYSPQIRFLPEITVRGLPLAAVERQTGAASSKLDIIGMTAGRITRLNRIDGNTLEIAKLDGSKLPFVIAHRDANILDVPRIYRWSGVRFVEDSDAHRDYYRELFDADRAKLSKDASGAVLVNLARIAVLAGKTPTAKQILRDALSRERGKGDAADPLTVRLLANELRTLAGKPQ